MNSTGSGNFQSDKIALVNGAANDFVFGGSNVINFTDLSGGSLAHGHTSCSPPMRQVLQRVRKPFHRDRIGCLRRQHASAFR